MPKSAADPRLGRSRSTSMRIVSLARAVQSEKAEDFSSRDVEGDAADRVHGTVGLREIAKRYGEYVPSRYRAVKPRP